MNRPHPYDPRWNAVGAPLAAQAVPVDVARADREKQYSLFKILMIWAAAVVPMVVLGWVVAPLVGDRVDLGVGDQNREAFARGGLLTVGLIWQFVLVITIVWREEGDVRWSTIRRRCWLNTPRDPRTGTSRRRLWWWLVPAIVVLAAIQLAPIAQVWKPHFLSWASRNATASRS